MRKVKMIVERFVDLCDVPLYSLKGWVIYDHPIVSNKQQPMIKNIDIISENNDEIVQFFMDRYWNEELMEQYVKALNKYSTIADVEYQLNGNEIDFIKITWR